MKAVGSCQRPRGRNFQDQIIAHEAIRRQLPMNISLVILPETSKLLTGGSRSVPVTDVLCKQKMSCQSRKQTTTAWSG